MVNTQCIGSYIHHLGFVVLGAKPVLREQGETVDGLQPIVGYKTIFKQSVGDARHIGGQVH